MDKNAALADSMVLRIIFEEYIWIIDELVEKDKLKFPLKYEQRTKVLLSHEIKEEGRELYLQKLLSKELTYEWPIPSNKDMEHNKRIISKEAYRVLKKKFEKL